MAAPVDTNILIYGLSIRPTISGKTGNRSRPFAIGFPRRRSLPVSWLDAHLWAYAEYYNLEELLSEDFQHDRLYGTVKAVNPFCAETWLVTTPSHDARPVRIGEPTVAAAVLDPLLHHRYKIEL